MDYKNGKIYTIRSNQTDDIYIGSTCSPLYKRLYNHKQHYNSWVNRGKNYMSSYEIIKYDDCYIELLEEYPCENKQQLRKREGELQREMKCVNKEIAGRTKKEWYDDNKDRILENKKQKYNDNRDKLNKIKLNYYYRNKDEILKKKKEKMTCECGSNFRKCEKSRHEITKKHQNYINNIST